MAAKAPRGQFELFVARRYLRAKRKQAVISLITILSVLGVAAGVLALVVALGINNGFRSTLQASLLGASAHVTVLEKEPGFGIRDWREVAERLVELPYVTSAEPALYGHVLVSSPLQSEGSVLKGIQTGPSLRESDLARRITEGSIEALDDDTGLPGIVLGSRLSARTGLPLGSVATLMSPQGEMTPFGPRPSYFRCRVVGILETGFFELDSTMVLTSLRTAQRLLSLQDVVNAIELHLDDLNRAPAVTEAAERMLGPHLAATNWIEQNQQIFRALKMEKAVTVITIGLIVLVAALNILIALVMMVMEKNRDIAILISMGARREQIRRIFTWQGLMIGAVGTVIGLAAGHTLCYLADRYRWIRLEEQVYALSYVPFDPRWVDSIWIAAAAILISYLATIYPARNATRIAPAESLRYE